MRDDQFIALMALLMCSDPWPTGNPDDQISIENLLDDEANERGFTNWKQAYSEL